MSAQTRLQALETLVQLRDQDVDRLRTEVATKIATRARFEHNVQRLQALAHGCGTPHRGAIHASQLGNIAGYKAAVLTLAQQHEQDLALHNADLQVTQNALQDATRRKEVLSLAAQRQHNSIRQSLNALAQKQQDELATQTWLRRLA